MKKWFGWSFFQQCKVNDPVIDNVPVIVILFFKYDKVLKKNSNWSILQQLTLRHSKIDYKKLSKSMIIK